MRIAVGREVDLVEDRVAATPETVKKMTALGAEVAVEPGAGVKSGIPDAEYVAADATVSEDAVKGAEIVVYCANLQCPSSTQTAQALQGLGYTNVADYEAGKADWIEAGLPVESGAPAEIA